MIKYIKEKKYIGLAHILDVDNPAYEEKWAYFYMNLPIKEPKNFLAITRADKYLEDKMLYVTMVEVDNFDDYLPQYYRYTLDAGEYFISDAKLLERDSIASVFKEAYEKSNKDLENKEIIEYFDLDSLNQDYPTCKYLFKLK